MEENVMITFLACHELRPLKDNVEPREEHHYVAGLKHEVETTGAHVLYTRYSPLVKLLERSSQTKAVITTTILDILEISWSRLENELKKTVGNLKDIDIDVIVEQRKKLAMVLFLTYRAILEIENFSYGEVQQKYLRRAVGSADKRKGQTSTHFPYWPEYRQKLLDSCLAILELDLNQFWGNHEVETGSDFLRCVLLFCMIILRQSSRDVVRDEDLSQTVYSLLGILSTKYGEEQSVISRLVPIVKESEDGAKAVTGALIVLTNNFGREMVIFTAVKDVLDMYTENLSKESVADKSLGVFLQEITKINQKAIIKCLPLVLEFLEAEAFGVRNSVLTICSELLVWSKKNQGQVDIKLREHLVEIMLNHLLDGNGFVRSKVIQLLTKLIQDDSLYTFEKIECLVELQKRVFDKTPTARKHAIAFFSEMIEKSPALIKFNPNHWRFQVRENRSKLIHLLTKDLDSVEMRLKVAVKEFLEGVAQGWLVPVLPMATPEIAIEIITGLLNERKYWEACEHMHNAIKQFQDDAAFQLLLAFNSFEVYIRFFKSLLNLEVESEEKELEEGEFAEPDSAKDHRPVLDFFECSEGMSRVIYELIPKMARLLDSGLDNDRNEVISFYARLVECNYEPDEAMNRAVLESVRHIDGKTMVNQMDSFCIIFFRGIEKNNNPEQEMVKKLIELANTVDTLQKGSLRFVVRELVNAHKLDLVTSSTILWDAFLSNNVNWGPEYSRGAVFLLGILGTMERNIITANLEILIEHGFGPRGYEDLLLMRAVCDSIYMLTQGKGSPEDERERFDPTHMLFEKLREILVHGLKQGSKISDEGYVKVAEIAIRIIYGLCTDPSDIISPLVKDITTIVFSRTQPEEEECDKDKARSEPGVDLQEQENNPTADVNLSLSQPGTSQEKLKARRKSVVNPTGFGEITMSEGLLYRYVSMIRFLFGSHINYYDKQVLNEINRRKQNTNPVQNNNERHRQKSTASKQKSMSRSRSSAKSLTISDPDSEIQEMIGSTAYDHEKDMVNNYMSKICESGGCFKIYRTHVLYLCRRINDFRYSRLKSAIIACLSKTMSISSRALVDAEQVFLDAWKDTDSSAVKCELIRGSIILNVRYPSRMEKINACILTGLTDADTVVRMATLDSIIYLTLKDLMKTRDQLADSSVCLLDPSSEVQEMVKDFFSKCNEKGNTIQNALPEILSRLIQRPGVDQVALQDIMKFLLGNLKPEKRAGGLVDKIANLYQKVTNGRYSQDLAFCLKQFTYNEKSMKFIIEHLPHYADKLGDDIVFDAFCSILENARKNCKPEHRVKLDDYEKDFKAARETCVNHLRVLSNVNQKDAPAEPIDSSSSSSLSNLSSDDDNDDFKN